MQAKTWRVEESKLSLRRTIGEPKSRHVGLQFVRGFDLPAGLRSAAETTCNMTATAWHKLWKGLAESGLRGVAILPLVDM